MIGRVFGDLDRHAGLRVHRDHELAEIGSWRDRDRVIVVRFDHMIHSEAERHRAVRRSIAEDQSVVLGLDHICVEDAVGEHLCESRVERTVGSVRVAVLMIDDLRRDHDRRGMIDEHDLVRGGQDVARLERHQSPGANAHVLSRRGRPQQVSSQRSVSHVERAFVLGHSGHRKIERLVVHVELEDGGIGHVDDRLSCAGEPERVFGVDDRPRLVEAVHECARRPARSSLFERATGAEVSVGK